ncbi:hypothetical protein AALP_AA7G128500 [Arabis alpina]|uniref:Uncharacterized protein n=1 Tax=Arabis alpina TaxID=50452 RepID=A0A087GHP6_ARAAL|nr:hypothetical protein AALP_AA7G128500 [Arabis alpina]
MLLTLGTSTAITQSPSSVGFVKNCRPHSSNRALSPSPEIALSMRHRSCKSTAVVLIVFTKKLAPISFLPKPPDPTLSKPPYPVFSPLDLPPPADPPPYPPNSLEPEHHPSLLYKDPTNHHPRKPPSPLYIRWVLTLSIPPWLTIQRLNSGLTKSFSIGPHPY